MKVLHLLISLKIIWNVNLFPNAAVRNLDDFRSCGHKIIWFRFVSVFEVNGKYRPFLFEVTEITCVHNLQHPCFCSSEGQIQIKQEVTHRNILVQLICMEENSACHYVIDDTAGSDF